MPLNVRLAIRGFVRFVFGTAIAVAITLLTLIPSLIQNF